MALDGCARWTEPAPGALRRPRPPSVKISMARKSWTARRRARFLEHLRRCANVSAAARTAGMSRSSAYALRRTDEEFAARWDEALEEACDALEEELRRRAMEGVERPVFHGGRPCGVIRSYSDQLGMFLLRAHRPERFAAPARGGAATESAPARADADGRPARERLEEILARLRERLDEDGRS